MTIEKTSLPPERNEEEQSEYQEYRERVKSGETLYWCAECSEFREQDDLVQVRECPHCQEAFDGSSEGRNCPSCNRPFSRLLTEEGCGECLGENPCELLTPDNWNDLVGEVS